MTLTRPNFLMDRVIATALPGIKIMGSECADMKAFQTMPTPDDRCDFKGPDSMHGAKQATNPFFPSAVLAPGSSLGVSLVSCTNTTWASSRVEVWTADKNVPNVLGLAVQTLTSYLRSCPSPGYPKVPSNETTTQCKP